VTLQSHKMFPLGWTEWLAHFSNNSHNDSTSSTYETENR